MADSNHDILEHLQAEVANLKSMLDQALGAYKLMSRLTALFGGLMTAAIIGSITWAWDAHAVAESQTVQIERISEQTAEAVNQGRTNRLEITNNARALAVTAQQSLEILRRLDQVEESNQQILLELRRRNR